MKVEDLDLKAVRVDRWTEGVTRITFDRPEKKNAMDPRFHDDMVAVLDALRHDDDTHVVVLTGAGEAFCAGMDLKAFFTDLHDDVAEYERVWQVSTEWRGRGLRQFPKPIIAMVNGYCFGGAFAMIEGCDIVVTSEDAQFGLSEINFGIFPGGAVSKAVSNVMTQRNALFYGLTGRPFDGTRAVEIGLATYAVPAAELEDDVLALAQELATKSAEALRATKEAYHLSRSSDWENSMTYAFARELAVTLRTQDSWHEEGIMDFLEGKFKPGLEGRPVEA
jgi:feruloyl-CoA hydratase/lyase